MKNSASCGGNFGETFIKGKVFRAGPRICKKKGPRVKIGEKLADIDTEQAEFA